VDSRPSPVARRSPVESGEAGSVLKSATTGEKTEIKKRLF